jgi:hypothetical protein
MPELVAPHDLDALFERVERTAWRLETRSKYGVDYETEPWMRWRRREPDDMSWFQPWLDMVRRKTAAGARFQRVRLVGKKLTDYQRFALTVSAYNTAAGEEIRYLRRDKATELGVPVDRDWWLIDDSWLIDVLFDDDDRLVGAKIDHDPERVQWCRAWRDILWRHAEPFGRYLADQ